VETLFTPWRYAYITERPRTSGCFLCDAAAAPEDPERLVLHLTPHHLVILNRHPYSNGHLMVAPREHVAAPLLASPESRVEMWPVVLLAQRVLDEAYEAPGMNLGMNLGTAAGAGVPDHFHFHVLPRWQGDTNFMTAIGGTRLVPESLEQTRQRLRPIFARLSGGAGSTAVAP
jgi:ATP adenylyltransferase